MTIELKSHSLKALAALLAYPEDGLFKARGEIGSILSQEEWISERTARGIAKFMADMEACDLLDAQEDYVSLFDRTPALSLHLFEHVHGDSRDRGQAMVELDALYREKELVNASEHTPDYLPMFLEYLSLLPAEEARQNLEGVVDIVAAIGERLKKRGSGYAVLFDALIEAARRFPNDEKLRKAIISDAGQPLTEDEIDTAWEELAAFAPGSESQNGGCPKAEEMLARMGLPREGKGT